MRQRNPTTSKDMLWTSAEPDTPWEVPLPAHPEMNDSPASSVSEPEPFILRLERVAKTSPRHTDSTAMRRTNSACPDLTRRSRGRSKLSVANTWPAIKKRRGSSGVDGRTWISEPADVALDGRLDLFGLEMLNLRDNSGWHNEMDRDTTEIPATWSDNLEAFEAEPGTPWSHSFFFSDLGFSGGSTGPSSIASSIDTGSRCPTPTIVSNVPSPSAVMNTAASAASASAVKQPVATPSPGNASSVTSTGTIISPWPHRSLRCSRRRPSRPRTQAINMRSPTGDWEAVNAIFDARFPQSFLTHKMAEAMGLSLKPLPQGQGASAEPLITPLGPLRPAWMAISVSIKASVMCVPPMVVSVMVVQSGLEGADVVIGQPIIDCLRGIGAKLPSLGDDRSGANIRRLRIEEAGRRKMGAARVAQTPFEALPASEYIYTPQTQLHHELSMQQAPLPRLPTQLWNGPGFANAEDVTLSGCNTMNAMDTTPLGMDLANIPIT